jgi:hypothetical protein
MVSGVTFGWAITTRRDENCDDASASVDGEILRRWERGDNKDKTRQVQPTCRGLIAASLCSLETLTSSQCKEGGGFTRSAGTMDSLVVSWELEPTQRNIRKRLRQKLGRSKQQPTHMNLVGRSGPARARPTSLFGRGHARCNLRRQEIRSCGPSRLAAYTNAPRRSHKL